MRFFVGIVLLFAGSGLSFSQSIEQDLIRLFLNSPVVVDERAMPSFHDWVQRMRSGIQESHIYHNQEYGWEPHMILARAQSELDISQHSANCGGLVMRHLQGIVILGEVIRLIDLMKLLAEEARLSGQEPSQFGIFEKQMQQLVGEWNQLRKEMSSKDAVKINYQWHLDPEEILDQPSSSAIIDFVGFETREIHSRGMHWSSDQVKEISTDILRRQITLDETSQNISVQWNVEAVDYCLNRFQLKIGGMLEVDEHRAGRSSERSRIPVFLVGSFLESDAEVLHQSSKAKEFVLSFEEHKNRSCKSVSESWQLWQCWRALYGIQKISEEIAKKEYAHLARMSDYSSLLQRLLQRSREDVEVLKHRVGVFFRSIDRTSGFWMRFGDRLRELNKDDSFHEFMLLLSSYQGS